MPRYKRAQAAKLVVQAAMQRVLRRIPAGSVCRGGWPHLALVWLGFGKVRLWQRGALRRGRRTYPIGDCGKRESGTKGGVLWAGGTE